MEMSEDMGVPPSGSGHSSETEPSSTVSAQSVSVPNAANTPSNPRTKEGERILQRIRDDGHFVCGDDGCYVYWPDSSGALNEWTLRLIADELERLNAPWVERTNAYFASREVSK